MAGTLQRTLSPNPSYRGAQGRPDPTGEKTQGRGGPADAVAQDKLSRVGPQEEHPQRVPRADSGIRVGQCGSWARLDFGGLVFTGSRRPGACSDATEAEALRTHKLRMAPSSREQCRRGCREGAARGHPSSPEEQGHKRHADPLPDPL